MKSVTFILMLSAVSFAFAQEAAAADKKTERQWKAKCGSCHGADGKGQTEKGKKLAVRDMTSAEYQKETDENLKKAITDGVDKTNKDGVKQKMEPYKDELKPEEITAMIAFIRELGAKK